MPDIIGSYFGMINTEDPNSNTRHEEIIHKSTENLKEDLIKLNKITNFSDNNLASNPTINTNIESLSGIVFTNIKK